MQRASEWLPLLALLLLRPGGASPTGQSSSSASRGSPSRVPALGPAIEVPRQQTGGSDAAAWFAPRFALALEVLGPNVPPDKLRDIALSVLAQWAHETNRGKSEFNFNLGGWRARRSDPYFVARDVQSGAELFRWTAYPDLPNAVHDQLRRLHDTFSSAWRLLLSQPQTSAWVEELGRRGYYTANRDTYARAWAMHRAELGALAP